MFDRDYRNPRIYSFNVGFERELAPSIAGVRRLHGREGRPPDAVPELQRPRHAPRPRQPPTRDTTTYTGANPFEPQLGDVFVTNSRGHGLYRGARSACGSASRRSYQLEANYVLSKDEDDDSNERDPFTDRSFNFYDLSLDYGPSDRDIRHKFNFFTYAELPKQFLVNVRMQGANGAADHDVAARAERRRSRPQLGPQGQRVLLARLAAAASRSAFGGRYEIIPSVEMFNTFNNANNVNPLTTPALFNFDGFLRRASAIRARCSSREGHVLDATSKSEVSRSSSDDHRARAQATDEPRAMSPLRRTIDPASPAAAR